MERSDIRDGLPRISLRSIWAAKLVLRVNFSQ
jgi:hypothetical protein